MHSSEGKPSSGRWSPLDPAEGIGNETIRQRATDTLMWKGSLQKMDAPKISIFIPLAEEMNVGISVSFRIFGSRLNSNLNFPIEDSQSSHERLFSSLSGNIQLSATQGAVQHSQLPWYIPTFPFILTTVVCSCWTQFLPSHSLPFLPLWQCAFSQSKKAATGIWCCCSKSFEHCIIWANIHKSYSEQWAESQVVGAHVRLNDVL